MANFREMLGRLAGTSPDLKPFEGKSTRKGRPVCEIAQAIGHAAQKDRFGATLALRNAAGIYSFDREIFDHMRKLGRTYMEVNDIEQTGLVLIGLDLVISTILEHMEKNRRHRADIRARIHCMRKEKYLGDVAPIYYEIRGLCQAREMNALSVAEGWYYEQRDKSEADKEAIVRSEAEYVLKGKTSQERVRRIVNQPADIREQVRAAAIELRRSN